MGENIFRIMEKIIIFFLFVLIVLIIKDYMVLPRMGNYVSNRPIISEKTVLNKSGYYEMTATGYTRHPECISPQLDDGYTATGTRVRKGVVAINVDLVNGKWIVNSILRIGQKIYITTMDDELIGYFRVEDTGPFKVGDVRGASAKDLEWDKRNCDIYLANINLARKMGCKPIKVYILN